MFEGPFSASMIKRAQEKKLLELSFINIRDFGIGRHKVVDDKPYGGGKGMILRVDVLEKALKSVKQETASQKIILPSAHGLKYNQVQAQELSKLDHLIIICPHYEGIDERVKNLIDLEISVGDFILTGGEIPAMLIIDSVARLIPGVLEREASINESYSYQIKGSKLKYLEYPHYTRPKIFKNLKVPNVLLSGNHEAIANWQAKMAKKNTLRFRPDLIRN